MRVDFVSPSATVQLAYMFSKKITDYITFFKLRLSLLVTFTAVMSYIMGLTTPFYGVHFIAFTVGTLFLICGANAFNQIVERKYDACMVRTALRPLSTCRMSLTEGIILATIISFVGFGLLLYSVNFLTILLATIGFFNYLFLYTPLKRVSSWCTFIGAISGAIPVVMGWTATRGKVDLFAGILFCILFFWQFSHFFVIGFLYRTDYKNADFKILPVVDNSGEKMSMHIVTSILLLILLSTLLKSMNFMGYFFLTGSLILGIIVLYLAINFLEKFTKDSASRLLSASYIFITVLFVLMVIDKNRIV
ncbi:MAG: heme o synthase [Planctomycetota bacterium]